MWTDDLFGVKKPIIALLHLGALPGDPGYEGSSLEELERNTLADLHALQDGGVDGLLIANEFSFPYQVNVDHVTVAAMAYLLGRIKNEIRIPFGVNVVLNPMASVELAAATGAQFTRSAFTGAYMGESGFINTDFARVKRYMMALKRSDLKLLFKVNPESDTYLAPRDIRVITKSIIFGCMPDALCVSGDSAGCETNVDLIDQVRDIAEKSNVPVFCNTGCTSENVREMLTHSDGVCMGTYFKKDGYFNNHVDVERVLSFMQIVRNYRAGL